MGGGLYSLTPEEKKAQEQLAEEIWKRLDTPNNRIEVKDDSVLLINKLELSNALVVCAEAKKEKEAPAVPTGE